MTPDEQPLAALVVGARNGDKRAWDTIVDRCAPLIWSICRRYNLSRTEAEDVGQTVWLRLVERIDTLREPAALPGWLATTTRRECVRIVGLSGKHSVGGSALDPDAARDEQLPPAEHELLIAERNAALWEAFAMLPPRCQRLLAMLIADPPVHYTEISATLGIAVGSIGPVRRRCLETLRNYPPLAAVIDGERTAR